VGTLADIGQKLVDEYCKNPNCIGELLLLAADAGDLKAVDRLSEACARHHLDACSLLIEALNKRDHMVKAINKQYPKSDENLFGLGANSRAG
jgi:hypothetical protein